MRYPAIATALAACVLAAHPLAQSQTPKPTFEVASVKPSASGPESAFRAFRGGRFVARYVTVFELIRSAYGKPEYTLTPSQVVGAPAWLSVNHFDVEATSPGTPDSSRGTFSATVLAMLRHLLEERFLLKTHFESRESEVFALLKARRDGGLGPGLRRRIFDCSPVSFDAGVAALADRRNCGGRAGPGMLTGNGATMTNLASALAQYIPDLGRIVVDRTDLVGTFDFDLRWTPASSLVNPNQGELPRLSFDPGTPPSLFTALQEQLGLKLEAQKEAIEVLVIDSVQQPTEN